MNEKERKLLEAAEAAEAEYEKAMQAIQKAYNQIDFPAIDAGVEKWLAFIEGNHKYLEVQRRLEEMLAAHDSKVKEMAEMLEEFEKQHHSTIDIICDTKSEAMQRFLDGLTLSDLKEAIGLELTEEMLAKFNADRTEFILSLPVGECVALYEYKSGKHRTIAKAKAQRADIVDELPKQLAVVTAQDFQYATSLHQKGSAYLQQFRGIENLRFREGRLYFPDTLQPLSEVELQNLRTKEGITEIDLPLLRVFYNVILSEYQKENAIKDVIVVYVPKLAEFMGFKSNLSKQEIQDKIINKIQSFHNITGILKGFRNGKVSESYYQVLNFEWYDEKNNMIAFSSPYMNLVIQQIFNVAIKTNKEGKPKLKSNGEPYRLPTHSYLIDSDIVKERNKAAVENVVIIVTLIEQAGDNTANIKAKTIIERNPQFQERLQASNTRASNMLLQRVFTKTWELLRTKTKLSEVYSDIQLPDPNNPANIPTTKSVKDMVFSFPHNGKKKMP